MFDKSIANHFASDIMGLDTKLMFGYRSAQEMRSDGARLRLYSETLLR